MKIRWSYLACAFKTSSFPFGKCDKEKTTSSQTDQIYNWLNLQVQEQANSSVFLLFQISLPCKFSSSVQICLEYSMYVKQSPNIFHLLAKKRPHGQKQTSVVILVLICLNKKPLFGIVSSWNTNIFNFVKIIWHLSRKEISSVIWTLWPRPILAKYHLWVDFIQSGENCKKSTSI